MFGESPDANDGLSADSYDEPKPPSLPIWYIRAWFNISLNELYNLLSKDCRYYTDICKQWNLSIQWVPSDYETPTIVNLQK